MSRIWLTLFALALMAFTAQTIRIEGFWRYPGLVDQLAAEQRAHDQTKANYTKAQIDAAALEQQRLADALAQQETINAQSQSRLAARFGELAATLQRLRAQAAPRAGGAPGDQPLPGLPAAAGGADPAPGADGLSLAERYDCSVYATQLDELISWVLFTAQAGGKTPDSVGTAHGDDDDVPDAAGRPEAVSGEGLHPRQ